MTATDDVLCIVAQRAARARALTLQARAAIWLARSCALAGLDRAKDRQLRAVQQYRLMARMARAESRWLLRMILDGDVELAAACLPEDVGLT